MVAGATIGRGAPDCGKDDDCAAAVRNLDWRPGDTARETAGDTARETA
jgi:hypothetical protein